MLWGFFWVSQKIVAGILLTQSGDRLCFPETVCVFSSLLQGLGRTLAQGEEVEGSLDLLLLLLWKSVQLWQDETGDEILLYNLTQEDWRLAVRQQHESAWCLQSKLMPVSCVVCIDHAGVRKTDGRTLKKIGCSCVVTLGSNVPTINLFIVMF